MMKPLLYVFGLASVVLLQEVFFPAVFSPAGAPLIFIIFALLLYKERPRTEAVIMNIVLSFLIGAFSGNIFLFLFLSAVIFGTYSLLERIFVSANNWMIILSMAILSVLFSIFFLIFQTPGSELASTIRPLLGLLTKITTTVVFSAALLPFFAKYFRAVSLYEAKIELPIRQ